MITTVLTTVLGATAAGWILKQIKLLAVFAAVLTISTGAAGLYGYYKGYNSAATQCKVNEITRERDEARRDLAREKETGEKLTAELQRQNKAMADNDQKVLQYAQRLESEERKRIEAEHKAEASRPKGCPACPRVRPCVVGPD